LVSDSQRSMRPQHRTNPGAVALLLLATFACRPAASPAPAPSGIPARGGAALSPDPRPVILFLGTSLTAGLGLDPSEAYPALIQAKLDAAGLRYRVVNAGVSGETSAGALRRIDWLLRQKPAALVVETGANDGLRGQDPDATRANLNAMLEAARRQSPPPKLVLVGMKAVTNYGRDYQRRFESLYPELARAHGAALVPFLLEGVAGVPSLNQADGIHPTAEGHRRMAETVWAVLLPAIRG
jgi:acyl-CoA thioesterase I